MKKAIIILSVVSICALITYKMVKKINLNPSYEIGQPIDSLNHVIVYYNGGVSHVAGRNTSSDNYNIGMKYQCVEFVKRYYYQKLHHKMPDAYGNAKDFFDSNLADSSLNSKRNLIQYRNPSKYKPQVEDLLIFSGNIFNSFGHVAIISKVSNTEIEIIQQNPGPYAKSRITIPLSNKSNVWQLENKRILGWLRKENENK